MSATGVARPERAESIRIALTTLGSRIPAPARRMAPPPTCGAAYEVPVSYFQSLPVDSKYEYASPPSPTATRSGFFRPPTVGPRPDQLNPESADGSAVPPPEHGPA